MRGRRRDPPPRGLGRSSRRNALSRSLWEFPHHAIVKERARKKGWEKTRGNHFEQGTGGRGKELLYMAEPSSGHFRMCSEFTRHRSRTTQDEIAGSHKTDARDKASPVKAKYTFENRDLGTQSFCPPAKATCWERKFSGVLPLS